VSRGLTAAEVGERLGYKPDTVRHLARKAMSGTGQFPWPIEPEQSPKLWRWSEAEVDLYIDRRARPARHLEVAS
jgi:predicted DNA-binding transcriptional regulator AlpA